MILGLGLSHNATACLIDPQTGHVRYCCSEERFSRQKNEWGVPTLSMAYAFEHIAEPSEITRVAIGETCQSVYGRRAFANLMYLAKFAEKDRLLRNKPRLFALMATEMIARVFRAKRDYQGLVEQRLRELGIEAPISFHDHHSAHAAGAYYGSPFDEALVVTMDGEGDNLSGSLWHGKGADLELVEPVPERASAGKFYRSITSILGLKLNRHEGKVTGLAAYGDPDRFGPAFGRLLCFQNDGETSRLVSKAAEFHLRSFGLRNVKLTKLIGKVGHVFKAKDWEDLLNRMVRKNFRAFYKQEIGDDFAEADFSTKQDIAAAAQEVLEEAICDCVAHYQDRAGTNLALAGGVFANVKLNQRLLERLSFQNVSVHPGMGDEGLAIGAAWLACHEDASTKKPDGGLTTVYLGPGYDPNEYEKDLQQFPFQWRRASQAELIELAAAAIEKEKIVAISRGRMEYGPRALGHRSILANPSRREINDELNARLKRTEYMPFAPAVLTECYADLFDSERLDGARFTGQFMTITLDVKPEWRDRLKAVVHVDGTARPQLVGENDDPVYYGIIKRFHERTGLPCVINTSFNLHEEPIVNTPHDALRSIRQGAADILLLDDYIVWNPEAFDLPAFEADQSCHAHAAEAHTSAEPAS